MPVTLKQVAEELGVSIVTVSKVLRGHTDIGQQTRARVLARVEEMGYRPNLMARSLVTGRTGMVGLLVPDLIHPFFAEIGRALAAVLRRHGLYLLLCASESDAALEQEQLEHLLSLQLDAILIAPVATDPAALERVCGSGTPLVLLDRDLTLPGAHFVGVDDEAAGRLATEHLLAQGCRRIAHFRGPDNSAGRGRLLGYRAALAAAGVSFDPALVSEVSPGDVDSRVQGAEHLRALLATQPAADGVFCFSDPMAIGALGAALAAGKRVPGELRIVGCGNLHYDDTLAVALSSVDQRSAGIGEAAANIVIGLLAGPRKRAPERKPAPPTRLILTPELRARASTGD